MNAGTLLETSVAVAVWVALFPTAGSAQSAIAGRVTDNRQHWRGAAGRHRGSL